jgi:hypothetical protein
MGLRMLKHPFFTRFKLSVRMVLRTAAQALTTTAVLYLCLFIAARSVGEPVPGPFELIKDVGSIWELARHLG